MDRHLGIILKISGFKMFLEDNSYLGGSTHCTPPPLKGMIAIAEFL